MATHNAAVAEAHGRVAKAMTDLVTKDTTSDVHKIVTVEGLFQKATAATKTKAVEAARKFANDSHQMGLTHFDGPSPDKVMKIDPEKTLPEGTIMVFLTDDAVTTVPVSACSGTGGTASSHNKAAQAVLKMVQNGAPPLVIGKVAKIMKVPTSNPCALPPGMYVSVKIVANAAPSHFGTLKEFTVSLADLKANNVGIASRRLHMALGGTAAEESLDLLKYEAHPIVVRDDDEDKYATIYPHEDRTAAKQKAAAATASTGATPAPAAAQTVTVIETSINQKYALQAFEGFKSRVHPDYLGKIDPKHSSHTAVADQVIAILKRFFYPGQKPPKLAANVDTRKAWDVLSLNFHRTTIATLLPATYSFHDIDLMVGLIDRIQHEVLGTALTYFPRWYLALKINSNEDCNGLDKGEVVDLLGLKLREMSTKPLDLDDEEDNREPSSRERHLFGAQWDEADVAYRQALSRTQSARLAAASAAANKQQGTAAKSGAQQKGAKRQKTQAGAPKGQSLLQKHSDAIAQAGAPPAGAKMPCLFGKQCKNRSNCTRPHTAAEIGNQTYADALKTAGMALD